MIEHISIDPKLVFEQKNEYIGMYTKKHKYQLPKKNFINLLKKCQDDVVVQDGKWCWFPDRKTFDEVFEQKKDQVITKFVNGEERKYITLDSWTSMDNANPVNPIA